LEPLSRLMVAVLREGAGGLGLSQNMAVFLGVPWGCLSSPARDRQCHRLHDHPFSLTSCVDALGVRPRCHGESCPPQQAHHGASAPRPCALLSFHVPKVEMYMTKIDRNAKGPQEETASRPSIPLWRHRDYMLLWGGQTVS